MSSVLAWYRQLDSVIVGKCTVLRVVDHGPESMTLAVEDTAGAVFGHLSAARDAWTAAPHGLRLRYDGEWPDERSTTHTRAGIEFAEIETIDVRPHSIMGTAVRWRDDHTRYRPPDCGS